MQIYELFYIIQNYNNYFFKKFFYNTQKSLTSLPAISSSDPSAVTKFFIVSCATESYEMRFCGTVPQIVVHFDL